MAPNPLNFSYDFNNETPRFVTKFAKKLYVANPTVGDVLLKLTFDVFLREHGGNCSPCNFDSDTDFDNVSYVDTDKKHVIVYFLIPNTLADNIEVMVDDDNMLINNDETSELFKSWYHYSDCRGSRVCGLHDSYVPKNIEYVKIGLVSCN